jgi:diaminopimelate decarboxylase
MSQVANAGAIISRVQDIVETGAAGYTFLKLDTGMTEILRPSLYGAQHPLVIVPYRPSLDETVPEASTSGDDADANADTGLYIVVGHCCESGDLLTPAPGDSETLLPRRLGTAQIGDYCVIESAGAYCSAMNCTGYNSFPQAAEVLLESSAESGGEPTLVLIRERQKLADLFAREHSQPLDY